MELASVAALDETRVIGNEGEVPWTLPEDRRQYRSRIAESPVILGRVTFESMRDDLPGSIQIVMSRSPRDYDVPTAYHAGSVDEAVDIAASQEYEMAYVIGGGGIFRLFQPHLDRMFLSRIPGEHDGDTLYPEWDSTKWTRHTTTEYENFTVEEWHRTEE